MCISSELSALYKGGFSSGWSLPQGVFCQGGLCQGGFLSGWSLSWWTSVRVVSVKVDFCQRGLCHGGFLSAWSLSRWIFVRVVSVKVDVCQGGLCQGGFLSGWSLIRISFMRVVVQTYSPSHFHVKPFTVCLDNAGDASLQFHEFAVLLLCGHLHLHERKFYMSESSTWEN